MEFTVLPKTYVIERLGFGMGMSIYPRGWGALDEPSGAVSIAQRRAGCACSPCSLRGACGLGIWLAGFRCRACALILGGLRRVPTALLQRWAKWLALGWARLASAWITAPLLPLAPSSALPAVCHGARSSRRLCTALFPQNSQPALLRRPPLDFRSVPVQAR